MNDKLLLDNKAIKRIADYTADQDELTGIETSHEDKYYTAVLEGAKAQLAKIESLDDEVLKEEIAKTACQYAMLIGDDLIDIRWAVMSENSKDRYYEFVDWLAPYIQSKVAEAKKQTGRELHEIYDSQPNSFPLVRQAIEKLELGQSLRGK